MLELRNSIESQVPFFLTSFLSSIVNKKVKETLETDVEIERAFGTRGTVLKS